MTFIKSLLLTTALIGGMAYANTCEMLYDTDPKSAISVCQKELNQNPNDPTLQFYMGYAYNELQDYGKAVEWYAKSANQGDAKAQHNLGAMYYNGQGVKKDTKTAKLWFGKACDNGHQRACQYR